MPQCKEVGPEAHDFLLKRKQFSFPLVHTHTQKNSFLFEGSESQNGFNHKIVTYSEKYFLWKQSILTIDKLFWGWRITNIPCK